MDILLQRNAVADRLAHSASAFIVKHARTGQRGGKLTGTNQMLKILLFSLLTGAGLTGTQAATLTLEPSMVTEWKTVYGQVESRDVVPARARIGGVIVELTVNEGDPVKAGEQIGLIKDDKIAFQIAALDAQLAALQAQLSTAEAELKRGETLVAQGVITRQRLGQLSTDAEVARNALAAAEAQRDVITQQQSEGALVAPADGRVLTIPSSRGAVILAGEAVVNIGSGGFYLRLAIPERFAAELRQDAPIRIATAKGEARGVLVRIYPQIDNGRVIADVEVDGLDTEFVNARILVQVPVGSRQALAVPEAALQTRHGLDFVTVDHAGQVEERVVVRGETIDIDGKPNVEIMSGLSAGDTVVLP
ncbi:efflux RND transporter periplasmic adaptor subunit [Hoeflea marina]|uniref:efflux RND transporter periplasmic adaptor subunit n=1 Tax=Hoeflea marina TaxID=274592 RepID=UPI001FE19DE2|nr:efflux RND transporter periplasmic adaptor subunit [Hoeflea marina]